MVCNLLTYNYFISLHNNSSTINNFLLFIFDFSSTCTLNHSGVEALRVRIMLSIYYIVQQESYICYTIRANLGEDIQTNAQFTCEIEIIN